MTLCSDGLIVEHFAYINVLCALTHVQEFMAVENITKTLDVNDWTALYTSYHGKLALHHLFHLNVEQRLIILSALLYTDMQMCTCRSKVSMKDEKR